MLEHGHKLWRDGGISDFSEAGKVSVLVHTLHYGVGAFEGIRAYEGADGRSFVFRLDEHLERLCASCRLVGIEPRYTPETLARACQTVLTENAFRSAYLRPLVFLEGGLMGLSCVDNVQHTLIIAWKWGAYLGEAGLRSGVRCKTSPWSRHEPGSGPVRGKITGQYVTSVLAKNDAIKDGYDEALLLDSRGYVCEGTGENLFVVMRGRIITPPLSASVLPGITRDTLLTLAREDGFQVEERLLLRDDVILADEVFLTGTAAEVTPVVELDGRRIGPGGVGEVTAQLQQRYLATVRGADPSHPEWLTEV